MWKSNPDATIEDLDGKSGPGRARLPGRIQWRIPFSNILLLRGSFWEVSTGSLFYFFEMCVLCVCVCLVKITFFRGVRIRAVIDLLIFDAFFCGILCV